MKYLLLFCLLLPVCGRAEDVYHVHRLSERERLEMYTSLMRDACHHADQFWQDWPVDARAGFWGSGRSDQMNEGVRAIAGMTLTCGTLLKYSDALSETERKEYSRKAIAAIRYAVATHLSGTQKCPDGKPWGGSWQSAMWTSTLAFGAWLIWDELDPGLQKDVERVVGSEADRFLKIKPPAGSFNDTKAEENGWDMTGIAIAANMFPQNPHAAAWREKAIEYAMNTLSAPQDRHDNQLVDGRPVSEWFTGANVHTDFTLENHGFFHPAYVGCSSYFMTQMALQCTYAHLPVPQAATHHLQDVWQMFEGIILPWGESAFPQGMDWELHGLPFINLYASLATRQKDALASRMEDSYLQYMRAWQVMRKGDLAPPGSRLAFTRHAICAEQAAYGFLAHKIFGPAVKEMPARKAASLVEGVRMFEDIAVITHRTADKFVSFSWTNRIMGMLVPIGEGHENSPMFSVPMLNGLVGSFELVPRGDVKTTVVEHDWKKTSDGCETTGTLLLNGGRLEQTVKFTSMGDKTVVYQDRVTALTDVSVAQERGVPLGIENDEISGGIRMVSDQDGKTVFDWQKQRQPVALRGSWANVDGRLGVVTAVGMGMTYVQATGYQPGISVCTDILYGSFSSQRKQYKAGDEVAHRVVVFYLEITPKRTSVLAQSVRIENKPDGEVLHFKLAEGGEAEVPLL